MYFDPPHDSPLATDVPCVVVLSIGGGVEERFYGPFPNLLDARDWCARQRPTPFRIIPMRRTDIERTHGDWYDPQYDAESIVRDMCDMDKFLAWMESHQK